MALSVSDVFEQHDTRPWRAQHWIAEMPRVAIRQSRDDDQWYVTRGYGGGLTVLSGPHASVDAAAMLLAMGVLDVKEG